MRLTSVVSLLTLSAISFAFTAVITPPVTSATSSPEGAPGNYSAVLQSGEYIQTFASDCSTPQTIFYLGDKVCAIAGNFPLSPANYRYRRFQWAAPNQMVASQSDISGDPEKEVFVIPTSGDFAQVGTWTVRSIDVSANVSAIARLIVRNPRARYTDLFISKSGPLQVLAGDRVRYTLRVTNPGPDDALEIEITDNVPTNMVFVGLRQSSGPVAECRTPPSGGTGTVTCWVKNLPLDQAVELLMYYQVNPDAREGTVCSSQAWVSSTTSELAKENNETIQEATVPVKQSEDTDVVSDP